MTSYRHLTGDEVRWIVNACMETASLLFVWRGRYGDQPILMPGAKYLWWRTDVLEN